MLSDRSYQVRSIITREEAPQMATLMKALVAFSLIIALSATSVSCANEAGGSGDGLVAQSPRAKTVVLSASEEWQPVVDVQGTGGYLLLVAADEHVHVVRITIDGVQSEVPLVDKNKRYWGHSHRVEYEFRFTIRFNSSLRMESMSHSGDRGIGVLWSVDVP